MAKNRKTDHIIYYEKVEQLSGESGAGGTLKNVKWHNHFGGELAVLFVWVFFKILFIYF